MTREQVVAIMRRKAKDCESQTRAADSYSISAQYFGDVLAGRRAPSGKLLKAMGLEQVTTYRRIADKVEGGK